jgi:hypothetical protein
MEMRPITGIEKFLWDYGPAIFQVYGWLLFSVGIAVCGWAFKKTKIKAYLLVGLFFLSPFFNAGMRQVSYWIHKEEYEKLREEKNREFQEMRARGEPVQIEDQINLPVFETFLVLGLLLVAKSQIKGANQSPETTTASAAAPQL